MLRATRWSSCAAWDDSRQSGGWNDERRLDGAHKERRCRLCRRRSGAMSTTDIDTDRFRGVLLEERKRVVDAIDNIHAENPGSLADETEERSFQDNHLGDV